MTHDLRLVATVRREFSDWRLWLARALVMTFACAAGLTVVGFTWLTDLALHRFLVIQTTWWSPLLWTPLCTGAIVWLTRRYFAGAACSGPHYRFLDADGREQRSGL